MNKLGSDVHEDIGFKSADPSDTKVIQKLLKHSPTQYQHESEEKTAQRRARCLEAIFGVFENPEIFADGLVIGQLGDRKFHFWPASDTYFIFSSQKYGYGIEKLCDLI